MLKKLKSSATRAGAFPSGSTTSRLTGRITLGLVSLAIAAAFAASPASAGSLFSYLSTAMGFSDKSDKARAGVELSEAPQYTQGFEVDGHWGAPTAPATGTTVNRVASGTNGITSRTGGFHGSVRANIVPPTVTKVSNLNPQGWAFFNEGAVGSGSFVTGPATPPLGTGSVNLTVDANGRHNIGKINNGLRFDRITELGYSSYQTSGNPAATISLQLQVDYDLTDANQAFQGRLVYEPYQTETVLQNTWQTWTPLTGEWWGSGAPGNVACPQSNPCTWPEVLAAFPNGGTHGSPTLGAIIFRAGGPVGFPFTGNVDNFTLGVDNVDNVTDFELANHLVVDDDGLGSSTSCDDTEAVSPSIADSVAAASPGNTITVCPGTYPQSSTLSLNKANLTIIGAGPSKPVIQVASSIGDGMNVSASGVTLNNLEIQKTDLANQTVVHVGGNNFTATNNLIYGPNPGMTWNAAGFVSRAFIVQSLTGTMISNNTIHTLRQPAYMSGQNNVAAGTISNNTVSGTKGWVVEGGNYAFTGNMWGEPQNQDCDIALLNQATLFPGFYQPLLTLSTANDNAFICAQYAGGENGRAIGFVDDSAGLGGNGSDNANYQSINAGIAGTLIGGTVQVAGGTYNEDVAINKSVKVLGAGSTGTTIVGPKNGPTSTVAITASDVELSGFSITRDGNNVADWNDANGVLNLGGLTILGQTIMNALVHDNNFVGNRSAIDVNNSNGHTFRNNVIDNNHTGVIFRNQTDNITFVENTVTNNRTVGVLFLDASIGTNVPVQTAANCTFFNNSMAGNWYGEIVDRQSGGAIPAPGTTNLKNFSGNWYGTNAPVVTTANSAEPGYPALIPVIYGGTATDPGGQPDIAGPASANFDFSPFLNVGTDTNNETVSGRGTFGFQGSFNALNVSPTSAQVGATSKIQEAIDLITPGGTLTVPAGTYPGNVNVNKALTIQGTFTVGGSFTTSAPGVVVIPGTSPGIISTGNLSFGTGTDVNIELNGVLPGTNYDRFQVTGTVTIASGVDLNVSVGYSPGNGDSYTIINNDGGDAVSGTFNGLADGQTFFVGANSFTIDYDGGDGNDVVITSTTLCNSVSIPNNITTLTGTTVNVPVNVDAVTGNGILSADFTVNYNPAVLTPNGTLATNFGVTLGTVALSNGSRTLTVNNPSAGTLIVSVFGPDPMQSAAVSDLVNMNFNVIGAPGTTSPMNFSAFKFNEGTPCLTTTNGLVTVISGTISGTITYGNVIGMPTAPRFVPDVTVNAVGSVNVSASTGPAVSNGQYTLSGMGAGAYTVTPSKVGGIAPGGMTITSFDAAQIAQHVVSLITLNSTQLTVADVSGSAGVTSFDAALISRWIVLLPGSGATGNWIFQPASRSYPNVNANDPNEDYTALLMGDVSGNWYQGLSPARPAPSDDAMRVGGAKMSAASGTEVLVPMSIGDTTGMGILGYQFDLRYDPAVLEPMADPVDLAETLSKDYTVTVNPIEPGLLKVVVFGALPLEGKGDLLNLRFNVIGAVDSATDLEWENLFFNEGGVAFNLEAARVTVTESKGRGLKGRVLDTLGNGIAKARVTATDTLGKQRSVMTSESGSFSIAGLEKNQTYTLTVESRGYRFFERIISLSGDTVDLDIIAQQ